MAWHEEITMASCLGTKTPPFSPIQQSAILAAKPRENNRDFRKGIIASPNFLAKLKSNKTFVNPLAVYNCQQ